MMNSDDLAARDVYFVYIDETDDGRPFYVGKGKATRVKQRYRNKHWRSIASKHGWKRRIVAELTTEQEALELEIALVRLHGTFQDDPEFGVWGANHTAGGDGMSGYRHTEAQRAQIRASLAGAKSNSAKLTWEDVREIRMSTLLLRELVAKYGVALCTIKNIRRGKTWVEECAPLPPKRRSGGGWSGKKHTAAARAKMSESARRRQKQESPTVD